MIDQNNKNKAPTNISTNLMALNAVTSNIITTANTNSTNAVITTSELAQAAHNIMLRLGSVNSNISYDAGTQTVTISAGEIDNNWLKDRSFNSSFKISAKGSVILTIIYQSFQIIFYYRF